MERLINIGSILNPQNISEAQQKGRSVETSLHDVIGTVECTLEIENTFNNVKITSILQSLGDMEIDQ